MANDFFQPTTTAFGAGAPVAEARFSWADAYQRYSYLALVGFSALLVFSFWNMFEGTSAFWQSAQYSHGYIVPLIALYLMWSRRPNPLAQEPSEGVAEESFLGVAPASTVWQATVGLGAVTAGAGFYMGSDLMQGVGFAVACLATLAYVLVGQPWDRVSEADRWIGFGIIILAYVGRVFAATIDNLPMDRVCFLIALAGLFFMVGGMRFLKWAGPAVLFLIFMYPIPSVFEASLLGNLQKIASICSEIVITILGIPVVRSGNVIEVDGVPLTVAEQCSGLRMLTIFCAIAVAMTLLINRPWWDKFIIILSSIPIALLVNILRIVVTAILYRMFPDNELIHRVVHDYAGFAMVPVALGFLYLEMQVLTMLSIPEEGLEIHAAGVS